MIVALSSQLQLEASVSHLESVGTKQSFRFLGVETTAVQATYPRSGKPGCNVAMRYERRKLRAAGQRSEARRERGTLKLRTSFACLCLALACPLFANTGDIEDLATKYEDFLLFQTSDYEISEPAATEFEGVLLPKFRRAVRDASVFSFERRGELAYFVSNLDTEEEETDEQRRARESANSQFHRLFNLILPTLAYAYRTPGTDEVANP